MSIYRVVKCYVNLLCHCVLCQSIVSSSAMSIYHVVMCYVNLLCHRNVIVDRQLVTDYKLWQVSENVCSTFARKCNVQKVQKACKKYLNGVAIAGNEFIESSYVHVVVKTSFSHREMPTSLV
jgi:hypothetical protein